MQTGSAHQALAPFAPTGGTDRADTSCQIALRTAHRPLADYGYPAHCDGATCWTLWESQVDVSQRLLDAGGVPVLLFHPSSEPTWWQVDGWTATEGAPAGYQRLTFTLDEHTLSQDLYWGTLLDSTIDLIPAVELPDGERWFDHNRVVDPLQSYRLSQDNSWSIADDSAVCWGDRGRPVRLASAQVSTLRLGGGQIPDFPTVLNGLVETWDTSDPDARVEVHYQVRRNSEVVRDWTTAAATAVDAGLWEFEVPSYPAQCPHYCDRIVYQFAIAFTAEGQTYWDNNSGRGVDYRLASDFGGAVPVFWAPPALLDVPVRLSYAAWRQGRLEGEVLVRNLDYEKRVSVRYSTDGWESVQEIDAHFDGLTISPELEYWRFSTPLDPPGADVRFAVRYETDGQVSWDNHQGRDYVLATPAGEERAIPRP